MPSRTSCSAHHPYLQARVRDGRTAKALQSTLLLVLPWEELSLLMTGYVYSIPLISREEAAAGIATSNQSEADQAALNGIGKRMTTLLRMRPRAETCDGGQGRGW